MKGIIVGKEIRDYADKNTGEMKQSRTLYVVWDAPSKQEDGCSGSRVEAIWARFPVDDLKPGDYCEFQYDIRPMGRSTVAVLVGIDVIEKREIVFKTVK